MAHGHEPTMTPLIDLTLPKTVGPLCLLLLFPLLLIKLSLLFSSCVLILLILGDEIVHVGFSLGEFHLVHSLASVPMQESLASEHGRELLGGSLEELLDGGRVADESGG